MWEGKQEIETGSGKQKEKQEVKAGRGRRKSNHDVEVGIQRGEEEEEREVRSGEESGALGGTGSLHK
jgi:hypothetical protein